MGIGVGALTAAFGFYLALAGLGLVPPPGKPNPHAPLWIAFCAGLVFLLGGLAVLARALAGDAAAPDGAPAGASPRLQLLQQLLAVAIFACLASIATWIAIGPGPRGFNVSGPFFSVRGGAELAGRIAFGIGALVTWLCAYAFAANAVRKFLAGAAHAPARPEVPTPNVAPTVRPYAKADPSAGTRT
jgi:hypothetical protein